MHHAMAMMEEYYPRPNEYLPERWIAKKGEPLYHGDAHPFASQPFGFGVRSCIGQYFLHFPPDVGWRGRYSYGRIFN
jgi:cytochrome P450